MKKLIMTVAVVAFAGAVSAQVYSDNVVGYAAMQKPDAGKFSIVAFQFGDSATIDVQNAIVNVTDLNAASSLATQSTADKLYLWNGASYDTYALYYKITTAQTFWLSTGSPGWNVAVLANPLAIQMGRGASAWFETGTGGAAIDPITLGEVPDDDTYDITLSASGNFTLICYPFSTGFDLNLITITNGASASSLATQGTADKIYLWNGASYDTYALYYKITTAQTFWLSTGSPGWNVAVLANPLPIPVDMAEGFWYESPSGTKTIGFTQNYSLLP